MLPIQCQDCLRLSRIIPYWLNTEKSNLLTIYRCVRRTRDIPCRDVWLSGAVRGTADCRVDYWTAVGRDSWTSVGRDCWTAVSRGKWTAVGRYGRQFCCYAFRLKLQAFPVLCSVQVGCANGSKCSYIRTSFSFQARIISSSVDSTVNPTPNLGLLKALTNFKFSFSENWCRNKRQIYVSTVSTGPWDWDQKQNW